MNTHAHTHTHFKIKKCISSRLYLDSLDAAEKSCSCLRFMMGSSSSSSLLSSLRLDESVLYSPRPGSTPNTIWPALLLDDEVFDFFWAHASPSSESLSLSSSSSSSSSWSCFSDFLGDMILSKGASSVLINAFADDTAVLKIKFIYLWKFLDILVILLIVILKS